MKESIHIFKSIEDLRRFNQVQNKSNLKRIGLDGSSSSTTKDDIIWTGTKSYEESDSAMQYGIDCEAKLLKAALDMRHKDVTSRPVVKNDVRGSRVSVGRFLAGQPNCMKRKIKVENEKPVIKIICDISHPSHVNTKEVARVGAIILNTIYTLEGRGVRVELYCGSTSDSMGGEERSFRYVKVKDSGSPLNLKKVAFFLLNPSFQRRILFRALENSEDLAENWAGYGGRSEEIRNLHGQKILGGVYISANKIGKERYKEEDLLKLF